MKTLIIYPENKKQLVALKSFMKEQGIFFEEQADGYSPHFITTVKDGLEQIKKGETRVVSIDNL